MLPLVANKGFCRNPRGNYLNKVPGEFCGGFFGGFLAEILGPFSLDKIGGKNPPKTPRQNSNRNLGVSQPKSTLQGSGLDKIRAEENKNFRKFVLQLVCPYQNLVDRTEHADQPMVKQSKELEYVGFGSVRKSLMSIIFPPAILVPEMAVPILCAPGIFGLSFFCWKEPHAQKIPRFRRGGEVPLVLLSGACAMTTEFLDNKIRAFKILIVVKYFRHKYPFPSSNPLKKTQKSRHHATLCDTILHYFV